MSVKPRACIILAAGKGTRMYSNRPKVLHELAGRSMLGHVLDIAAKVDAAQSVVVIGPDMAEVATEASEHGVATCVQQKKQLGTADAVKCARAQLSSFTGHIVVLYADTPLISADTLNRLIDLLDAGTEVAVLGFRASDPTGYGRLILDDQGELSAIREDSDASAQEREIDLCNSGVMAFASTILPNLLDKIGNDNAKGEYYLTDAVAIAREQAMSVKVTECQEEEVLGVNTRQQLSVAEAVMQNRLRSAAMAAGVTMQAPDTVFLMHDTRFGRDVKIEPHVVFGANVSIGNEVTIKAFSHIEGAQIEDGAIVGPFARLRPGAHIGPGAKVGNFVEIKNAMLETGAKVNHLTYIGDARVGEGANVGAGTITCNYDGFAKHHTDIGAGAFIGSNSALIAPIKIGDGAYVGSGSVLSRDVPPDALVVTRAPVTEKQGWAKHKRHQHKNKLDK